MYRSTAGGHDVLSLFPLRPTTTTATIASIRGPHSRSGAHGTPSWSSLVLPSVARLAHLRVLYVQLPGFTFSLGDYSLKRYFWPLPLYHTIQPPERGSFSALASQQQQLVRVEQRENQHGEGVGPAGRINGLGHSSPRIPRKPEKWQERFLISVLISVWQLGQTHQSDTHAHAVSAGLDPGGLVRRQVSCGQQTDACRMRARSYRDVLLEPLCFMARCDGTWHSQKGKVGCGLPARNELSNCVKPRHSPCAHHCSRMSQSTERDTQTFPPNSWANFAGLSQADHSSVCIQRRRLSRASPLHIESVTICWMP